MYAKHARLTYTIANYLCTRQVLMYLIGPINQRARPTPLAGPPTILLRNKKTTRGRPTCTMYAKPLPRHTPPPPHPLLCPAQPPRLVSRFPQRKKFRGQINKMEPGLERSYNRGEPQGRSCNERGIQGKHTIATAFFV